ncbi:MAG: C39 family peptidase [Candidatus Pacebacteria bacterium]|nr:C39 family peptidase [Candidatus Paceibacterota bacterium]
MKLNVPYISQRRDIIDEYWQERACGAVSLKMVLDFINPNDILVDDFVKQASDKGAYSENGWLHQGLINIAKDFDVSLEREEFKSNDLEETIILLQNGIDKIIDNLKNNKPVIISAIKKWTEETKFHMLVVIGFELDESSELKGFYYHDSDCKTDKGKDLFVPIETFRKYWRKMAIFVK